MSHVLTMQKKLAKMSQLPCENICKAQQQKRWFDQNAWDHEFQVGERVFVLLSTFANKLLAQWQGQYRGSLVQ